MRWIVFLLVWWLVGCTTIADDFRDRAHTIGVYKTRILDRLIVLIDMFPDRSTELYWYEDRINEDCRALNQGLDYKFEYGGQEVPDALGHQIVSTLDQCQHMVQQVDRAIMDW